MAGRNILSISILASALLLAGCATGFQATHDHDPAHDFSGYRSYAWIGPNPMKIGSTSRIPNPLLESRIMASFESGLAAKGFTRVADRESADFILSFTVGSREEIRVDSYPSMYGAYGGSPYWGWGGAYYGMGMETSVRQYQQGMLALDVFAAKEKRPVFHGVATKSITESDRKKMDETINAAVSAILQGFPPQ